MITLPLTYRQHAAHLLCSFSSTCFEFFISDTRFHRPFPSCLRQDRSPSYRPYAGAEPADIAHRRLSGAYPFAASSNPPICRGWRAPPFGVNRRNRSIQNTDFSPCPIGEHVCNCIIGLAFPTDRFFVFHSGLRRHKKACFTKVVEQAAYGDRLHIINLAVFRDAQPSRTGNRHAGVFHKPRPRGHRDFGAGRRCEKITFQQPAEKRLTSFPEKKCCCISNRMILLCP